VAGIYEPGSTFKLQDAALALDSGTVNIWNGFDASAPIHIGRFTIKDFEGGKHRWLYVPEIVAYSSNIGAARMAEAVGGEKQRLWMDRMGMLSKLGIELPEAAHPQAPGASNWKQIATMTIGFGHGISVSPLHVVAGTAAISNGGTYYRPTLVAGEADAPPREGFRVMQQQTSDIMRKLMRVVVTEGYGKLAEVPGYYIGGKTGTAEKISHHGYNKKVNVSAFMSAFPMNAPRYAVYMMLDEPHGNASTGGYSTAGAVSAPAAGRVVAKIGPMLEMLPDIANAPAINAALSIPLQPGRPAWAKPSPGQPAGQPPVAGGAPMAANPPPVAPRSISTQPPAPAPAPAARPTMAPAPAQVVAVR
jgi:cell division protein FtsI (penicillin-binding protein 3)